MFFFLHPIFFFFFWASSLRTGPILDQKEKKTRHPLNFVNRKIMRRPQQITNAEQYIEERFPVRFPLYEIGEKTYFPKGWTQLRVNTYDRTKHGDNSYILCGSVNNIIVIDCDVLKPGDSGNAKCGVEWIEQIFSDDSHPIWQTFIVRSKSGGYHFYFQADMDIKSMANAILDDEFVKIDTRGVNSNGDPSGCIRSPLSPGYSVWNLAKVAPLPQDLKALLVTHTQKRKKKNGSQRRVQKDKEYDGEQADTLVRECGPLNADAEDGSNKALLELMRQFFPDSINDVRCIYRQGYSYLLPLSTNYCMIKGEEHGSNHPYIIIRANEIKYTCHNPICMKRTITRRHAKGLRDLFDDFHSCEPEETFSAQLCCDLWDNDNPEIMFEYLNQYFCKILLENETLFCNRESASMPWILRNKTQCLAAYEHITVLAPDASGKMRPNQVLLLWKSYKFMRTFRNIKFNPNHDGDKNNDFLNLWKGFAAKELSQYDMTLIQLILDHQRTIFCHGDEKAFKYLIDWQAAVVQFRRKIGTMIGIKSKQGAGKNIIWEFFGKMVIGENHYYYCDDMDQFVGKFNGHLAAAILVVLDEVTYANNHKTNNKLKSLLTQETQTMEKKHQDAINVKSHLSVVALSNNPDFLKIEDSCRRNVVFEASDERIGDRAYFNRLVELTSRSDVADHYMTFLMQRDLSDFCAAEFPETEARIQMKELTRDPVDSYCIALREDEIDEFPCGEKHEHVNIARLWNSCLIYCETQGTKFKFRCEAQNQRTFETKMKHFLRHDIFYCTRQGHASSLYTLDLSRLSQRRPIADHV